MRISWLPVRSVSTPKSSFGTPRHFKFWLRWKEPCHMEFHISPFLTMENILLPQLSTQIIASAFTTSQKS
jgi:hypothetical protein